MLLVFGLSIMSNTIGGQLDERLNAFMATHPVVIYILYVINCDFVANKMMMMNDGWLDDDGMIGWLDDWMMMMIIKFIM